jgi:hypothetical protein
LWNSIAGQEASSSRKPEVIIHDPASSGPHDLDDTFFDRDIQERIGKAIAKAAEEK